MVNIDTPTCAFDIKRFTFFCKNNSISFPPSFVDFLVKHNDAELNPNIISGDENGIYIRYFYGTTDEDYSDLASVYEWYTDRLPPKCIPIADPDFGNKICMALDENHYGKIYFWDHETMDTDTDEECILQLEDMILLADSFEELLDKIKESPYQEEVVIKKKSIWDWLFKRK